MVKLGVHAHAAVKRGPASWNYIYVFLGFALTIESSLIQMIAEMDRVSKLLFYFSIAALTIYPFLFDGWFQNKLTCLRNSYEEKWR